ncbi:MAG: alpha-glucosidase C-terminal domain-containing protein [Oscillospiraceae bacterium]
MQERRCSGIPVFAPAFQVRRHGYPWGIVGERSMSNRRRRMKIQSCTSTGIYWPSEGNPLIRYGTFGLLCADDPHIFAYVRTYQGKRLLVICNFSEKSQNAAAIYPNPEAIRFHNYPSITPAVASPV